MSDLRVRPISKETLDVQDASPRGPSQNTLQLPTKSGSSVRRPSMGKQSRTSSINPHHNLIPGLESHGNWQIAIYYVNPNPHQPHSLPGSHELCEALFLQL